MFGLGRGVHFNSFTPEERYNFHKKIFRGEEIRHQSMVFRTDGKKNNKLVYSYSHELQSLLFII